MYLKIVFPLLLFVGEPQDWCQLLKSPVRSRGGWMLLNMFLRFCSLNGLFGGMYEETIVKFIFELILTAIESKSKVLRITSCCCIELWIRRATPPYALVAVF